MQSIRCRCGKIVCQVANAPVPSVNDETPQSLQGPAAVILCRHCKRYVVLRFQSLSSVYVTSDVAQPKERTLVTG